jgi:hypothetical protein
MIGKPQTLALRERIINVNNTTTTAQTPAQKLERVRGRVRTVTRAVQVTEGRLLDFDTADDIMRALHTAARELEELALTIAVMSRRGGATDA